LAQYPPRILLQHALISPSDVGPNDSDWTRTALGILLVGFALTFLAGKGKYYIEQQWAGTSRKDHKHIKAVDTCAPLPSLTDIIKSFDEAVEAHGMKVEITL